MTTLKTAATHPAHPPIVVSRTTVAPGYSQVYPTQLSASKAAGIAAIRLSQVNGDVLVEELNANHEIIIGFRLHPLVESGKNITAIAITQLGSSPNPLPLTAAQRSAFGLITNELKTLKTPGALPPSALTPQQKTQEGSGGAVVKGAGEVIAYVVACGGAAAQEGLNPVDDVGCLADLALMIEDAVENPTGPPVSPFIQTVVDSVSAFGSSDGSSGDSGRKPADDADGATQKAK
jgi:hypothetical protein